MSFKNFIQHTGIITIPSNVKNVKENMIPNLKKNNIGNVHMYIFKKNKSNLDNNSSKNFKINDLFNIYYKQKITKEYCNNICKDLCRNHLYIIKEALKLKKDNVMILEDDARFIDNLKKTKVEMIIKWLRKNKNWDILLLGGISFPYPLMYPVSKDIFRCNYPTESHCYILSKTGMEKMLRTYESNHYDLLLQKYLDNKYICVPSICNQNKSPAMFQSLAKKYNFSSSVENYNFLKSIHNKLSILIPLIIFFTIIRYIFIKVYYKFS